MNAQPDPSEAPSRFERLMDVRLPLWLVGLLAVIGVAGAILLAGLTLHGERGGKRLPWLVRPAQKLAELPSLILNFRAQSVDPFAAPSVQDAVSPPGLWRAPGVSDPGYLLLSGAGFSGKPPYVQLIRLADGKVMREFHPDVEALRKEAAARATEATSTPGLPHWLGHPELMEDGGLLSAGSYLLSRLDSCARTVWSVPDIHHSIERDAEGQIWAPSASRQVRRFGAGPAYIEDALTRISPDGKVTLSRPLSQIFDENGLEAMYLGKEYTIDPFHLNDIEPVLSDGPHWKRGDLFLSMRHLSLVMLYRPSTGKILWFKQGPWIGQHDVNILDDHRIAIFDNQSVFSAEHTTVRGHSDERVYDFNTGAVTAPWSNALRDLKLAVRSNGRGTVLADGSLIAEESNGGRIVRLGPKGELQWRYMHADANGTRYRVFWARYLDPVRYAPAIKATLAAKCS